MVTNLTQPSVPNERSDLYTFTVFTPTFNRARIIHRVYDSLKQQTYRNFEWLIVDDGTDETAELVQNWSQEADFPILYTRQKTPGLHLAFNTAAKIARGEFFLFLPDDDACVSHALERFKYYWDLIPEPQKPEFTGVTALCISQHGTLVGRSFPKEILDISVLEAKYKYGANWEMWGFNRTDVMREFPFPDLEGQRFIPEDLVWYRIGAKYKTRFINEVLRTYWVAAPGDTSQLTGSGGNAGEHAFVMSLWHRQILNDEISWFRFAPHEFFRSAVHYARFSFHDRQSLLTQVKGLKNIFARCIWLVMLPIGYLVYIRDSLQERNRQ